MPCDLRSGPAGPTPAAAPAETTAGPAEAAPTDAYRHALEILWHASLPSRLPAVHGLSFAARYSPALDDRVGGDWFDVVGRRDGSVALVLGDVGGSGLRASGLTVQVRNTVRAFLLDGAGPATALSKVDALYGSFSSGEIEAPMVTVAVAVVERSRRRLRYALAGHLPPVLAYDRATAWLHGAVPGPPLGVVDGGARYREATRNVSAGSVVALLSDGLVERRGECLVDGMARVVRSLDALVDRPTRSPRLGRDLEQLAECLFEALDAGRDDRSLVVCRIDA